MELRFVPKIVARDPGAMEIGLKLAALIIPCGDTCGAVQFGESTEASALPTTCEEPRGETK
jgi:hypothetical protein